MTTKKSGSGGREKKRSGRDRVAPKPAPKRTWLRVAGILLLAVWMFVLGVLVGRGTAPVRFDIQKLQKELASLKAAALKRSQSSQGALSGGGAPPGGIDPADLEFYEDLRASRSRLNFKPVVKAKPPSKHPAAKAAAPEKTAAAGTPGKKAHTEKKAPSPRKSAPAPTGKKTAAPRKVARAAPPVSRAPSTRQSLTIQVASVKSQHVAERMVRDLKKKGYAAYTRIGKVPGKGIWYRVRVGRFASRQEAAGVQSRLRRDNWKAVIVSR